MTLREPQCPVERLSTRFEGLSIQIKLSVIKMKFDN